jgi:hypothetical protein
MRKGRFTRHIRRSQPTREAALKDACAQLLQGHAVNRIVGPNETITAKRVKDWCAKHRSFLTLAPRTSSSSSCNISLGSDSTNVMTSPYRASL